MGRRNKVYIYNIILVNHGKQIKNIAIDKTETRIYKKFNKLLKENRNVMFPIRYNNEKHVMVESEYELVIIKCKQEGDKDVNKVRNDYGKFVDYETDDEDWIVVDRAKYELEETFWVYGYHPKLQRKDFNWIFNEFIKKNASNKYMFKSVQLYKNKLLIECDGKLEMVICKNKSDCIRMYNTIQELAINNKFKYIAFMGDVSASKYKNDWIKKIQELTHWKPKKIIRNSTRP